ncbi:ychF [Symbiodinium natans]|uniref:YchF protein n=1 Tax=Symbiodinium natans TaxID=878477 RepID=A0A812P005_9DINO|nr:ychF [Symbiodinium natans]
MRAARPRVLLWACLAFLLGRGFVLPGLTNRGSRVARAAERREITKVEICIHRDCKRRGGGAKLRKVFEDLAAGTDIEVGEYDCFDECPFGPNVRTLSGPDDQFGRVLNGVKGEKKVAEILGVDLPEEEK